jgi:hypothetical protein
MMTTTIFVTTGSGGIIIAITNGGSGIRNTGSRRLLAGGSMAARYISDKDI